MFTAFGTALVREVKRDGDLSVNHQWKLDALLSEIEESERAAIAQQVKSLLAMRPGDEF